MFSSDSRVCPSIIDAILIALLSPKTPRPVYGGYARAVTVFKRRWS
jgi:hypothetical protein